MKTIALLFTLCLLLGLLSWTWPVPSENVPVRVMTFNVRYDNPDDAPNDWPNRRDFVGELIRFYHPDFIGTQEVLYNQLEDMQERLPEYQCLGVGRDDGKKKGEFSAIFYKNSDYELLRTETFWLSENPQKVGVAGWDAACNRVVTWGKFKQKATGRIFFMFNTHFDHRGVVAREESAKLLLRKVAEIAGDQAAIITGDFNASPNSNVYETLTQGTEENKGLLDTYQTAKHPYGPTWTFTGFGNTPVAERQRIDYIFTNQPVAISQYAAISEQRGEIFPSDHLPVMAEITFGSR